MIIKDLGLEDVKLIEGKKFIDSRGYFSVSFNKELSAALGQKDICQVNNCYSKHEGTIRGIHYQLNPNAQGKLVRVVRSAVFDVAVDLRKNSPTFGMWVGEILTAKNQRQLWVPRGFGHAFCTLTHASLLTYSVDNDYSQDSDRSILWSDPAVGISWPVSSPILSEKDASASFLKMADVYE